MGSAPLNESLNVFRFRRKLGPSATTAMAPSCIRVVKLKTSSIVRSDANIPPACTHRKLYGIRPSTRQHKHAQLQKNHHKPLKINVDTIQYIKISNSYCLNVSYCHCNAYSIKNSNLDKPTIHLFIINTNYLFKCFVVLFLFISV